MSGDAPQRLTLGATGQTADDADTGDTDSGDTEPGWRVDPHEHDHDGLAEPIAQRDRGSAAANADAARANYHNGSPYISRAVHCPGCGRQGWFYGHFADFPNDRRCKRCR